MIGQRPTKARYLLTYEQMVNLERELEHRKTSLRSELWEKVHAAKEERFYVRDDKKFNDIKNEQRRNENRISEIERVLRNCEISKEDTPVRINNASQNTKTPVGKNEVFSDTVILGSKVLVHDYATNEHLTYSIVDTKDANSLKNKISDQSPLGKVLLGKKVGSEVVLEIGGVKSRYRIEKIVGMEPGYEKEVLPKEVALKKDVTIKGGKTLETFDVSPKDFLTRVHVFQCTVKDHQLMDIRCRIKVVLPGGKVETYTIPGAYCRTCKKFFLLEHDYRGLKQKGIPVCKIVEKAFWINGGDKKKNRYLNQESLLHMMGYNVNKQENLSKAQRWSLLEMIVDENIMTATTIRSHLQWLIRQHQNNVNYVDSRIKWKEDCDHMAKYAMTGTKTVDVKSITNVTYRKR